MREKPTLEEMRAEILFDHGVPPEFANDIESWALRGRVAGKPPKPSLKNYLVGLLILFPVVGAVSTLLWQLNRIPADTAEGVAREVGATFVVSGVLFGPFVLLALAVVICAIGLPFLEDRFDGRHKAAKSLWEAGLPGFYTRPIIAIVHGASENTDDFLLRFRRVDLTIRTGILSIVLLTGIAVTIGETQSFYVVGTKGIVQQKFWGGAKREFIGIEKVSHVVTDCYYSTGKSAAWHLRFDLTVDGGRVFRIGQEQLVRGDRLEALEAVAAALPQTTVFNPAVGLRDRLRGCIGTIIDNRPGVRQRLAQLLDPDTVGATR